MNSFDPVRYSGIWYEIGSYAQPFEQGCIQVVANYIWTGSVLDVTNMCTTTIGNRSIHGIATPTSTPGSFILQFDGVPFPSTYDVLWTDYSSLSLVGKPGVYFWILSRTPTLTPEQLQMALSLTIQLGFDPSKITYRNLSKSNLDKF